jgi:hypothetical protein
VDLPLRASFVANAVVVVVVDVNQGVVDTFLAWVVGAWELKWWTVVHRELLLRIVRRMWLSQPPPEMVVVVVADLS